MDSINLSITNINNTAYKRIVLRKFFYMVFFDANGRKLYAYIATVFGGTVDAIDTAETAYTSIKHAEDVRCSLEFGVEVNSDEDIVEKIDPKNLTEQFFGQLPTIEKVWGKCDELSQATDVTKKLKDIYPNLYKEAGNITIDKTNKKFVHITQKNRKSHECIVTEGEYELNNNKGASCNYTLSCPAYDGVEAMNWIRVELDFKKDIIKNPIRFTIKLDEGIAFTPDFTWYFAPPSGLIVGNDSSVKVGDKTDKSDARNAFQSVADETTVYFDEWVDRPESIADRKKSRILFTSAGVDSIEQISSNGRIVVSLHLVDPQGPTNRQFFKGLFIAFLLSFCSDKTRINDYYACLEKAERVENEIGEAVCSCGDMCYCKTVCNAVTIVAPILLIISFISMTLDPKKVLPQLPQNTKILKRIKRGVLLFIRGLGLLCTGALMIYVYCLWLLFPDIMGSKISCLMNRSILLVGSIISVICTLIYLIYCLVYLKRKVSNYL